jgi:hypothetical protein
LLHMNKYSIAHKLGQHCCVGRYSFHTRCNQGTACQCRSLSRAFAWSSTTSSIACETSDSLCERRSTSFAKEGQRLSANRDSPFSLYSIQRCFLWSWRVPNIPRQHSVNHLKSS